MSDTEIYDRYYDKMNERQLNELQEINEQRPEARNKKEKKK